MRSHLRNAEVPDGRILTFGTALGPDLQNGLQRCAQERQMEAERMAAIGMMTCSISHDMRHSLSVIYANTEFLERQYRCASTRANLLLEIQQAVLRITEHIDAMLQFARGGSKHPIIPECVSLVLERSIEAVKVHPHGRSVSISVGQVAAVEADVDAKNLESAIYNLVLNACQAARCSRSAPEVEVHVTEADEQIYITISDNGPGVPLEIRRTLFDPFVTSGKPGGTGLGLTLARRIAEEHGGSVYLVESNAGRTVFKLSLTKNMSGDLSAAKPFVA